ncbi:recombinase family protein [Nitrosomonas marina]|uniref:Site-specific DNA recombinase n=1 Tax=Nitrosomonas marina TaxID=917 RepID=A0A1H8H6F4_9PROT|nr:recombinase family protein [Nitrosomonas marina]SEN51922.1 Site-specific DNA recombinase [Nitrosomonas marina]
MTDNAKQNAVIYCRVSSAKQVREGHGLNSQETRCREYARHKGYDIAQVFQDEGVSGGLIDRPGIKALLAFLKQNRNQAYVVIIDDISRLARGLEAHIQLRTAISGAGGKLESPSIEFGEDSDSQLVENLLASVSQHQRQKNGEQVKNRMRARVLNGYWTSYPAVGYRYEKVPGHGKMLVRNEPIATIVQTALEGFASGRFETQSEVKQYLDSQEAFPKGRDGRVHYQRVYNLLNQILYTGYIDLPGWGIHFQPGKHEPLISFETWQQIQERLKGKAKAPARKDLNQDFPLRGFVTCASCNEAMTSCWSTGRNKRYAYYLCQTRECAEYGKSVRKEKIEEEFENLLRDLRPSQNLFYMALDMFRDLWNDRLSKRKQEASFIGQEAQKVERSIAKLLDRIVETDSPSIIVTYENRIRELENRKAELNEKIRTCGTVLPDFDETFRTAFSFLSNPHKLWASDRLEYKRTVLRLAFSDRLHYCRKEGFRTAQYALPFALLEGLGQGNYELVGLVGLEPTTKGL